MVLKAKGHRPGVTETSDKLPSTLYALKIFSYRLQLDVTKFVAQKAKGHRPGVTETSDKLPLTLYALMNHQHFMH